MTSNLQYGNLYKFQVSLGVFLFLIPFLFTYLIIKEEFDIFISQEVFLSYPEKVRELFENKLNILVFLSDERIVVFFFAFFIFLGFYCLQIGLINWARIQLTQDEMDQIKIKRMQESPKNLKIDIREVEEDGFNKENKGFKKQSPTDNLFQSHKDINKNANSKRNKEYRLRHRGELLEDACAELLKHTLGDSYDIYRNVRISDDMRGLIDIVALRKLARTGEDILYEIKTAAGALHTLQLTLNLINKNCESYKKRLGRTCKSVILAIVPTNEMEKYLERFSAVKDIMDTHRVEVELVSEDSLEKYMSSPIPEIMRIS